MSDHGTASGQVVAADLAQQIARVAAVHAEHFEYVRHEALTVPRNWVAAYDEYQSGGWWTTSLLNESGDPDDVIIRDCQPVPTMLLDRMPHTSQLLDQLGLRYMWVRIARLGANSFLWEHTDYGELGAVERCRLHIPLATNASAYLAISGRRIHLAPGWIWSLTPTVAHGVCNLYGPDRIHLILDCYADETLAHLTGQAAPENFDGDCLPVPTQPDLDEHERVANRLMSAGYASAAEKYLLRLFYLYKLSPGQVYDLIADQYTRLGGTQAAGRWRTTKAKLLGVQQATDDHHH